MIIIGHRGASGHAPEHTFASWDLALGMGADYIEQDLQMTADGVLIVMHDESLERTARGTLCTGDTRSRNWADIQHCDVGSWFNAAHPERARDEFAAQTLPRLEDVFSRYSGRAQFYIETKNPKSAPGMEAELLRLMAAHGLRPKRRGDRTVIIQSFSADSLKKVHREDPDIPLVRLFPPYQINWTIRRRLDGVAAYATGIGPSLRDVDARLIADAHARGLVVHPYTVNAEADMRRLIELGVDGMFTDYPDLLVRVRSETLSS
jgi:glycerophosphoryl diester phosphodiesterase